MNESSHQNGLGGSATKIDVKKKVDDMNQILIKIYSIVLQFGLKGVEYRQILDRLGLSKQNRQKFDAYLLSHYCRKLLQMK